MRQKRGGVVFKPGKTPGAVRLCLEALGPEEVCTLAAQRLRAKKLVAGTVEHDADDVIAVIDQAERRHGRQPLTPRLANQADPNIAYDYTAHAFARTAHEGVNSNHRGYSVYTCTPNDWARH